MTHATHYYKAGWMQYTTLVDAEIMAWASIGDPHGDPTVNNAGIIALYESWAEHIGLTYTDRTYGINTMLTDIQNPPFITYLEILEHRRNEATDHIPIGLYHDLIDGVNASEIAGDGFWGLSNPGAINDNISSLTNSQLFSLLTSSVSSPTDFINSLNSSGMITGNNTVQNVNILFNSY